MHRLTTILDFLRNDEAAGEDLYAYLGEPIVVRGAIDALTRDITDCTNGGSDHDSDSNYYVMEDCGSEFSSPGTRTSSAVTVSEHECTDNVLAGRPSLFSCGCLH